jgi:hypothetical protein
LIRGGWKREVNLQVVGWFLNDYEEVGGSEKQEKNSQMKKLY